VYEYPAGYRKVSDGEYLAQIRLEAKRVEARYVRGRSSVGRFGPAHLFTFGSQGGPEPAGEDLLRKVAHTYQNPVYRPGGTRDGGKHIYKNEFEAIPREVPFRPAVTTPRPNVDGYHTATARGPVGEDLDPERRGCAEGGRAEYGRAERISWRDAVEPITTGEPWRRALGPDSEADASGARYHDFSYPARAGERLVITATSAGYDPSVSIGTGTDGEFAALRTARGKDGRAVLQIEIPRDGEHVIRISTRGATRAGEFWVQVDTDAPRVRP
jgi:hypothetical protein